MFQINTERLTLTEFTVSDAYFILALVNTPIWLEYIGDKKVNDIPSAKNYLLTGPIKSYKENGYGLYKVCLKNSKPIGICGLTKRPGLEYADIGFAILPKYARKGYISEAAQAVMEFSREVLHLNKIAAITTDDNLGSINVLKKLGLNYMQNIVLPNEEREHLLFLKNFEKDEILS